MADAILTQKRLKELLDYHPLTGNFTCRIARRGCAVGEKVGYFDGKYCYTRIDYRIYPLHRLAWLYIFGEWPKGAIDHADRNPKNNAIDNLRVITPSQQQENHGLRRDSKSGYRGVSWHAKSQRWRAVITSKGKSYNLGLYFDIHEAAKAYASAAAIYHTHNPVGKK